MRLEVFAELHTLVQRDFDSRPLLPMVLSGRNSLVDKLLFHASRPFSSRIVGRTHLEALQRDHMAAYLAHHLRRSCDDQARSDEKVKRVCSPEARAVPCRISVRRDTATCLSLHSSESRPKLVYNINSPYFVSNRGEPPLGPPAHRARRVGRGGGEDWERDRQRVACRLRDRRVRAPNLLLDFSFPFMVP